MLLLRFPPHESAWWAPLNRFYAGLAGIAETCIGSILRGLQYIKNRGLRKGVKHEGFAMLGFRGVRVRSSMRTVFGSSDPGLQGSTTGFRGGHGVREGD